MLPEITIMDRAVYDMGALAGADWVRARIGAGKIADIYELLQRAPARRLRQAEQIADNFGLGATAGGMAWDRYKRSAYAAGWLAGINAALVSTIPAPRLLDALVTHGMPI